jgi:hypothetical protein
MEHGISLPCSRKPFTGSYPHIDESSYILTPISLRSILMLSSRLLLGILSGLIYYFFCLSKNLQTKVINYNHRSYPLVKWNSD